MHYSAVARAICKTAPFEEALINGFRVYPVLYDMPLKDCKSEMVKVNVWEKNFGVSGDNVSVLLTFSTSKNFPVINSYMYNVRETSGCFRAKSEPETGWFGLEI